MQGVRTSRFGPPEFASESRLAGVTKVVHMDAAVGTPDSVDETRWLESLADRTGWPNAIVATCDLISPDAAAQLDRHAEFSRFRGVRDMRPILADPRLAAGFAALRERGLVFCHTVGLEGRDDALALIRAFPEVTFCLDQAGMPVSRDAEYFTQWRAMLVMLAAAPNVVCKVSSLGMFEPTWTPTSRRPWIRACIDTFGPERCFFGSNWPIERKYSSYTDVVGAFRAAISDLTDTEQQAILAGNAERIFGI
jgi:predicted TIM-barrel fold metal-dependent hydrolase